MRAVDTTDHGIFALPAEPAEERGAGTLGSAVALVAIAWLGAVAFLARYRQTQVSRALGALAAPELVYLLALGAAAALSAFWFARGRRRVAVAGVLVAAFLLGHQVFTWTTAALWVRQTVPFTTFADGCAFAANRVLYVAPVFACMLAARGLVGRAVPLHLGIGNLHVASRDFGSKGPKRSWARLFPGFALFAAVLFVAMQAFVGFAPLRSGAALALLPAILVAAVANATVEELVFRGLLQPALVHGFGVRIGLWAQGLLFGLMHWGLSVGVLAALPTSLLIGLGSVVWGKAALETRGLGWVVAAHTLVDVAVMSAYFVR